MTYIPPDGQAGHGNPRKNGPFCFKEIFYRIMALVFLVAMIGVVFLIAEDGEAKYAAFQLQAESSVAFPAAIEEIFPDYALASAVACSLYVCKSTVVTREQLANIFAIANVDTGIVSDLQGIQYLTSLSVLSLPHHQIEDLSPLAGLTNLESLYLGWNQIRDLSPLAGLGSLRWLCLNGNEIRDFSPLAGLTYLLSLD